MKILWIALAATATLALPGSIATAENDSSPCTFRAMGGNAHVDQNNLLVAAVRGNITGSEDATYSFGVSVDVRRNGSLEYHDSIATSMESGPIPRVGGTYELPLSWKAQRIEARVTITACGSTVVRNLNTRTQRHPRP